MSFTQRLFLHTPVRDIAIIQAWINRSEPESDRLDFKRQPWDRKEGEEAMKDITALANNLGGNIILGVSDEGDCASGWSLIPDSDIPIIRSRISNWLTDLIHPRNFAELVDVAVIKSYQPGFSVIIVSVPPYAQLVGFEKGKLLGFSIRTDQKTRWLTFEEVMHRSAISTRVMYIKLQELKQNLGATHIMVKFASPVRYIDDDDGADANI
jgi:predicted HTH transcriptional regulator